MRGSRSLPGQLLQLGSFSNWAASPTGQLLQPGSFSNWAAGRSQEPLNSLLTLTRNSPAGAIPADLVSPSDGTVGELGCNQSLIQLMAGFLLIWQLVLVESGDSRPTDCQNQPTAKILGNKALARLFQIVAVDRTCGPSSKPFHDILVNRATSGTVHQATLHQNPAAPLRPPNHPDANRFQRAPSPSIHSGRFV